jgi:hypothetical protein
MFPFPCYTFRESLRSKNENSPVPTSKIISKFPFLWLLHGYLLQLLDAVLHRLTPSLAHQEACRRVLSVRRPRCRRSGHQRIATRPNRPTGHSAQRRHAPNDLITRGSRRNPAPGATKPIAAATRLRPRRPPPDRWALGTRDRTGTGTRLSMIAPTRAHPCRIQDHAGAAVRRAMPCHARPAFPATRAPRRKRCTATGSGMCCLALSGSVAMQCNPGLGTYGSCATVATQLPRRPCQSMVPVGRPIASRPL